MRRYRSNADEGQRELERAAAGGDPEAATALVRSYVRTGKVNEDQIRVLAALKAEPYREIAEDLGLEFPNVSGNLLSSPDMRGFLGELDTNAATDMLLSTVGLALDFPDEFDGPRGLERAQSIVRLMERVRESHSVPLAGLLWRMTERNAPRRRGRHYGPGGRVAHGPSAWQEENQEERGSAYILQSIFLPASRVVVVFYAHEVADKYGMGYGRMSQWWDSAAGAIGLVFSNFYRRRTRYAQLLGREAPKGPPFTRFRKDLTNALAARWGLPLVTTRRRRRRRNPDEDRVTTRPDPDQDLGLAEVEEQGVFFKTGVPVTFRYLRNTRPAPYLGSKHQQDIEPAGKFMLHQEEPGDVARRWETGVVRFDRPLVIWFNTDPDPERFVYYSEHSWKARLAKHYGLTGVDLSRALLADGYDAIVTVGRYQDPRGRRAPIFDTREIVDLRVIR